MIKAILLDLDNTLFINDDIAFARTFLRVLDEHFEATTQVTDASIRNHLNIPKISVFNTTSPKKQAFKHRD